MDDGRLRRKDDIREESDTLKQLLWHIANCYEQGLNRVTLNRRNPWSELGPLCFLPNQLVDFVTRAFKIPPRKTLKCAIFYESFTNVSTLAILSYILRHLASPSVGLLAKFSGDAAKGLLHAPGFKSLPEDRLPRHLRRFLPPPQENFDSVP